jgi:acyl carrier protein
MCNPSVDPTTLERLSALMVQKFKLDPASITPAQPLDQFGIDSLGMVELLFFIEDEFELKMPSNPPPFATVGDAVRYIDELLAAQRAAPAVDGGELPHSPRADGDLL